MGAMNENREVPLARVGMTIADFCERYFPDAFLFALAGLIVVFLAGLAVGEPVSKLIAEFGGGFWTLVPFTMQMVLIIIGGFVVASSPPLVRMIEKLAQIPKTPRSAVAFVSFISMLTSLLSWGLSLIFTGLLVREILRKMDRVDYRALGAAAYLGLGSIWALGFSSSAALLQATKSSIPAALLPITGVIPLSQTILTWQSLCFALILMMVSVSIAYLSCPSPENAKTAKEAGISFDAPAAAASSPAQLSPGERLEQSPFFSLAIGALMLVYLWTQIREKGIVATLDLNNFNFAFLAFGLLLHFRPRSFLNAVTKSVPATAGVLIQYPFYGGIFGLISKTAIATTLAGWFVRVTTQSTFPVIVAIYSALLGLFVPSGGAKWIIEAPYVMQAANNWHAHLGWTVQIYNAAEALPNLINPFWMLPLMGILHVRARDLAGYSILQLLFHAPIVILLSWLFARTFSYLPPAF